MEWISVKESLPDCWSQHRNHYGSGYLLGYTKYNEVEITQLWKVYTEDSVIYEWEGQNGESVPPKNFGILLSSSETYEE